MDKSSSDESNGLGRSSVKSTAKQQKRRRVLVIESSDSDEGTINLASSSTPKSTQKRSKTTTKSRKSKSDNISRPISMQIHEKYYSKHFQELLKRSSKPSGKVRFDKAKSLLLEEINSALLSAGEEQITRNQLQNHIKYKAKATKKKILRGLGISSLDEIEKLIYAHLKHAPAFKTIHSTTDTITLEGENPDDEEQDDEGCEGKEDGSLPPEPRSTHTLRPSPSEWERVNIQLNRVKSRLCLMDDKLNTILERLGAGVPVTTNDHNLDQEEFEETTVIVD